MSRSESRKKKKQMMTSAPRDRSWDTTSWPELRYFVNDRQVSETDYRIYLHQQGLSEHDIELTFKMLRAVRMEDD